jgi:uncharacterized protein YndB with AHSA1/START domain
MTGEPYRTSIVVAAERDAVFDHFTVPERIVRWMGDFAILDPRAGGEFTVDINSVPVRGALLEVDRPRRLAVAGAGRDAGRDPFATRARR